MKAEIPGISVEAFWIVRNFLMHDETVGAPCEEYVIRIFLDDLGVEAGMPVSMIQYGWTATPQPILDDDYALWSLRVPLDQSARGHPGRRPRG